MTGTMLVGLLFWIFVGLPVLGSLVVLAVGLVASMFSAVGQAFRGSHDYTTGEDA